MQLRRGVSLFTGVLLFMLAGLAAAQSPTTGQITGVVKNDLTLFFEWDNLDSARAFIASEELKAKMANAGVKGPPRVDFLTEVHSVRRSAAD